MVFGEASVYNGYLLCCKGKNITNTHSYYRYQEIEIMIVER